MDTLFAVCSHLQTWQKRRWQRSSLTTAAACARLDLPATMLPARCFLRSSTGPKCQAPWSALSKKDSYVEDKMAKILRLFGEPLKHVITHMWEKCQKSLIFSMKNISVCTFKTSPFVPAPRAHVEKHVDVVLVHTGTF